MKFKKVFKAIKNIIFVALLVFFVAVIGLSMITRISGGTPTVFGNSIFRVVSESMKPTLEIGDVILVRQCDYKDIKKGDIVTYKGQTGSYKDKLITHRVIKAPFKINDDYYITTQGDANDTADPDVKVSYVLGKEVTKLGFLNNVYSIFLTPWGLALVILLIILAFFNEIIIFIKALLGIGYKDEPKEDIHDIIERIKRESEEEKISENSEDTENPQDKEDANSENLEDKTEKNTSKETKEENLDTSSNEEKLEEITKE